MGNKGRLFQGLRVVGSLVGTEDDREVGHSQRREAIGEATVQTEKGSSADQQIFLGVF